MPLNLNDLLDEEHRLREEVDRFTELYDPEQSETRVTFEALAAKLCDHFNRFEVFASETTPDIHQGSPGEAQLRAETCLNALELWADWIICARTIASDLGLPSSCVEPGSGTCFQMQRLVNTYLRSKAKKLRRKFVQDKLPAEGFSMRQTVSVNHVPKWVWIPALALTCALVLFFGAAFYLMPTMTRQQEGVFRILIALCGGFAASFMGGSASLRLGVPKNSALKFTFAATGGIALFVYLYRTPPWWDSGGEGRTGVQVTTSSDAGRP